MRQEQKNKQIHQIIAKCWSDASFKRQLLAAPAVTLKAAGINWLDGTSIIVHENTDKLFHLVIPANPTDLSDDDLEKVAGGDSIDDGHEGG